MKRQNFKTYSDPGGALSTGLAVEHQSKGRIDFLNKQGTNEKASLLLQHVSEGAAPRQWRPSRRRAHVPRTVLSPQRGLGHPLVIITIYMYNCILYNV